VRAAARPSARFAARPPLPAPLPSYTWKAPWDVYSLAASARADPAHAFRYAVGSYIEDYSNKVAIIQLDEEKDEFVLRASLEHPYPTTKVQWAPEPLCAARDLLATSGDYLRLWAVGDGAVAQEAVLKNSKSTEFCAPITSFEWNAVDPNVIASCSVDTMCTVWDVPTRKVRTQLIAHDREVYDVAWSRNKDIFATVGADGSLRVFDLRALDHSTIMYEAPGGAPLLRLAWNRLDNFYIAAVSGGSFRTAIIDVRMPSVPVAELPGAAAGHTAAVGAVAWAPHSACHVVTGGDDSQALIWDLSTLPKAVEDPILAYT